MCAGVEACIEVREGVDEDEPANAEEDAAGKREPPRMALAHALSADPSSWFVHAFGERRSNDVANLGPGARVALVGAAAGGAPFRGVWGARDNGCCQYPASKKTVERRRDLLLRAATGARGRVWRGGAAAV